MPICKKCKKYFKNHVMIDGKWKNLHGRKFCLECSPFGENNRRNLTRPLPIEAKEVKCSKCGATKPSNDFYVQGGENRYRSYCKECCKKDIMRRKLARKKEAVKYLGGSCKICGYNKCVSALEFHHRDSNSKELNLSKSAYLNFKRVRKELDKCDLLCCRCHRETHSTGATYL